MLGGDVNASLRTLDSDLGALDLFRRRRLVRYPGQGPVERTLGTAGIDALRPFG
jgi:hypothetical protein